ncbi:Lsr2 family protein [Streptomyces verrucosisporus]|uniref:Lsr2 family DNA-binding protein n=1 Tax=Streptomyces verrucosisporus TaxID=1695161 RepID=UPI0019D2B39B|nr:histone-like nucleoid-structuring protein Lsr2 [Streptomyces verrucosisporus]MBN3932092.1 Lsr2 family protein [Streptomyces verrucosisporus]
MTALDDLIRLCPPPAGAPAVDWPTVETTLGTRLPGDHKHLASVYGPGAFCDFLHIYHPHAPTPWANLTGPMPATLRDQLTRDRGQGRFPVPHDPQALFAVGVTDNGDHLFWITAPRTAPDTWRITVNQSCGRTWYTFDGPLTGFLAAVLSRRVQVPVFPEDLLGAGTFFTPSPARTTSASVPEPGRGRRIDSRAVRAWARANGYGLPDRGRIPAVVLQAWEEAHPG